MNRFLAAFLNARKLGREIKIATDPEDVKELRRQRRREIIRLGRAANELRAQGWVS
jgi:hypothetical protein